METKILSLIFFHILQQALCQYSCSIRPTGQCKPCDCVPDCFDLSDEINCKKNTSIHDVLLPPYLTREEETRERLFPPPPLPPFQLCPTITTTSITPPTRLPSPQPPVTRQPTQTPPPTTIPTFLTKWPTRAPQTTEIATRVFTTAPDKKMTTQSPWFCAFLMGEYYKRCIYKHMLNNYCIYVIRCLQMCRRSKVVPMTTPTTTTTTTPRPIHSSTFDYGLPPFDSYDVSYNNYDYKFYG